MEWWLSDGGILRKTDKSGVSYVCVLYIAIELVMGRSGWKLRPLLQLLTDHAQ